MQAKLSFYECLRNEWIPKLHELGFSGTEQVCRRKNGPIIYIVNLHDHRDGDRCCVKLGMHLTFLPASWARHALSAEKISAADCEFQWQLSPNRNAEFWWRYRTLLCRPVQSARRLIRTYFAAGQACFDCYQSVEDFARMFHPEELVNGIPPDRPLRIRPQRGALTMARIHLHLGNTEEAKVFALTGLQYTPVNSALKLEYEKILQIN